ncbi:hypothetical protein [Streptomyces sp. NPDC051211]|uniref:hypothetical protein n=1 Tax=Streptomyces sp. NPDC051211 TaxID=3154643 RepID=UPI00344C16E4
MRRLRGLAAPALAVALFGLAGCSDPAPAAAGSPATRAGTSSPPPTAIPSPPPTPTPTPTPTTVAPTPECVNTGAMDEGKLAGYLTRLKSSSGSYGSRGLTIDDDGLRFRPDPTERPCSAVKVKLTRFWVDITRGRTSAERFAFDYKPIDSTAVPVGPADGTAAGSVPPDSEACRGSLSVVHLGPALTEEQLPYSLEMPTVFTPEGRGAMDVKVKADLSVAATFIPPTVPDGC